MEHSAIAVAVAMRSGCPARLPSPKKCPLPKTATTASLPRVERTVNEGASHAQEALALTRRLGARASEAHALCLVGDVASTGGAVVAEGYYREALALAEPRGMRPLAAHCHLGLGKLYRRTGKRELAQEHLTTATTMYREMGMTYWLEKAEAEMND
jgi:hypothetical protein